jgi:hypothetical protein
MAAAAVEAIWTMPQPWLGGRWFRRAQHRARSSLAIDEFGDSGVGRPTMEMSSMIMPVMGSSDRKVCRSSPRSTVLGSFTGDLGLN